MPAGREPAEHPSPALGSGAGAVDQIRLHYLLSLVHSREHGGVEGGLRHGREALAAACHGRVEPGLRQYLDAWSRHAYGYALVRDGRIPEAVAQCQLALRRLAVAPAHLEVPQVELLAVRWYLLDDLARAASASGDAACAGHWGRQRYALARDVPPSRWPAMSWPLPEVPLSDLRTAARQR